MKTTVDIADGLLAEARKVAARDGVTLRALIERGLYQIVHERATGAAFKLRRASFRGKGLQQGFADASWERIRDQVYRDRGA